MRDLDLIKKELEGKVKDYLDSCGSEDEEFSKEIELEATVNGAAYWATLDVTARFSFEPCYENDKFGIDVYIGQECNLDSFDFEIKDLWDTEIEGNIVEDYKVIER